MSEALDRAARLAAMGLEVRSVELADEAKRIADWNLKGGNRKMRRQAAKAKR